MSRWFRFYADALRNPKVLRLSDKDFRLWVRLMAVASENDGTIPGDDDLKLLLSLRLDHLKGGLDRLISGGLIDALEAGYEPHNWSKFQYKSDTSTERVHKHRAKRNVSETPPDTETEEDKDPPKPPRKRRGEGKTLLPEDWKAPPVSELSPKARACAEQWTDASYETVAEGFVCYWRRERKMTADWALTWYGWVIREHSKVMRDQKFGNAAPSASAPITAEQREAYQARLAELDRKLGRDSDGFSKRGPPKPIAACLPKEMREFQAKQ